MRHRGHISEKDRQNRSRLAKLVHNRRLLRGSLVTMARTCGNPRCKCAKGKKWKSAWKTAPPRHAKQPHLDLIINRSRAIGKALFQLFSFPLLR